MTNKYEALDAAIIRAIESHQTQFDGIAERVQEETRQVAAGGPPSKPGSRYVDARLQALRKAGKIGFAKGHWQVVA